MSDDCQVQERAGGLVLLPVSGDVAQPRLLAGSIRGLGVGLAEINDGVPPDWQVSLTLKEARMQIEEEIAMLAATGATAVVTAMGPKPGRQSVTGSSACSERRGRSSTRQYLASLTTTRRSSAAPPTGRRHVQRSARCGKSGSRNY